jgi:para-nitrobenzyl esterase
MSTNRKACRLQAFFTSCVAVLALAGAPDISIASGVAPAVRVDTGRLDGLELATGVRAYLGVPYAAPPVRSLRWKAPQAAQPWSGVRHADREPPQCQQPLRGVMTNQYSGPEVTSEDCLYLNVWTSPRLRKAPVIVYIHGGAWFIGSGNMPLYSGEFVAARGAVFVNLNYRLGVLGFLAHPELTAESVHHASGNYALLDQVAALQWIRQNIAAFGGDPDNVTIVGQSAGAAAVYLLQSSPLAAGLFHRAFAMSAPNFAAPRGLPSLSVGEAEGLKVQNYLKVRSLADMRALPADRFALPWRENIAEVGPVLDGHVMPEQALARFEHARHHDVPLVVGFTRDEVFGGFGRVAGLKDYIEKAKARFGQRADEYLSLYPAATDAEAIAQAHVSDRDAGSALGMHEWARLQAVYGKQPVYTFEFARAHTYAPGVTFSDLDPVTAGAYHTSEVPFLIGTLDSFNRFRMTRAWTLADRELSARMTESLVAFARTGNPTTAALVWPRYEMSNQRLLEFGIAARPAPWPDARRLAFFVAQPGPVEQR